MVNFEIEDYATVARKVRIDFSESSSTFDNLRVSQFASSRFIMLVELFVNISKEVS